MKGYGYQQGNGPGRTDSGQNAHGGPDENSKETGQQLRRHESKRKALENSLKRIHCRLLPTLNA